MNEIFLKSQRVNKTTGFLVIYEHIAWIWNTDVRRLSVSAFSHKLPN